MEAPLAGRQSRLQRLVDVVCVLDAGGAVDDALAALQGVAAGDADADAVVFDGLQDSDGLGGR